MSAPMRVTIVRPHRPGSAVVGVLVGKLVGFAVQAWLAMVLIPHVIDWHPGYWKTAALIAVAYSVQRVDTPLLDVWSERGKKSSS